jgi:hypothetical protein
VNIDLYAFNHAYFEPDRFAKTGMTLHPRGRMPPRIGIIDNFQNKLAMDTKRAAE